MRRKVVHLVAAARPNFMKVAPLYHALTSTDWCEPHIVHTGQHYDFNMSDAFFRDLRLPAPEFSLGVGSGSHAQQTGGVMIAYEEVCVASRPDAIIVVGDVNSTAAAAIVGAKLEIPVIHLEAGLRSGDRSMPEEINRLLTDAVSSVYWTPSSDADENLLREGIPDNRIAMIGNMMIDSFEMLRNSIENAGTTTTHGLDESDFAVVTLHRPSNVDLKPKLARVVEGLHRVASVLQLIFVLHPRTAKRMEEFNLLDTLSTSKSITLLDSMPYIEFMNLVLRCRFVITDSGGLQEETTYLGIPCLTLRPNTERPITISLGTNRLIDAGDLVDSTSHILNGQWPAGTRPPLWDGKSARRAALDLERRFEEDFSC